LVAGGARDLTAQLSESQHFGYWLPLWIFQLTGRAVPGHGQMAAIDLKYAVTRCFLLYPRVRRWPQSATLISS
jgi:hypothetical protein